MSNRPSRIVVPIYTPSFDGRYWGRYPNGDKPNSGAALAADAAANVSASAAMATAIKMAAAATGQATAADGLSTGIQLGATAADIAAASGDILARYATTFPNTENPISEGGRWTNGGSTGTNWQNMLTIGGTPGIAYGAGPASAYQDCVAALSGFDPTKHSIQGICRRVAGYALSNPPEIELHVFATLAPDSIRLYEFTWPLGTTGGDLVRWNGPPGDFDVLASSSTVSALVDGDVVEFRGVVTGGSPVLMAFKNSAQILNFTDTSTTPGKVKITSGQPSMGAFARADPLLDMTKYCWRSITAVSLP